LNGDANGRSFTLELQLGLNSFGSSETDLVNNGNLSTSSIAEESAATVFLRRERVTSSGELATLKTRLVLIREDKIAGL